MKAHMVMCYYMWDDLVIDGKSMTPPTDLDQPIGFLPVFKTKTAAKRFAPKGAEIRGILIPNRKEK